MHGRFLVLGAMVAAGAGASWWTAPRSSADLLPPLPARGSGPVTVAAAGDVLMGRPLSSGEARGASPLAAILGGADVAMANLETSLLPREREPEIVGASPRRPFAGADAAETLKRLGINMVSLANNHAADYGADGIAGTTRILDAHGIAHAGAGGDIAVARAAAVVGASPRRIAVVAAATSAPIESQAAASWAGVNPLRFTADVTVDSATFETLKSAGTLQTSDFRLTANTSDVLMMNGRAIRRGTRTSVELIADADDQRQILGEIVKARAAADVVIVSLHTHEPRNGSDESAGFVRRFAHAAVDAGASLVVGHGPHRLRGIEMYGRGAILYSVGSFMFEDERLDARALDVYDSGADLYRIAMGAFDGATSGHAPAFDEAVWWEAIVAVATFERGSLTSLRLVPIDLGAGAAKARRGVPHIAPAERGEAIVGRLARLSAAFGTRVIYADGLGRVELPSAAAR